MAVRVRTPSVPEMVMIAAPVGAFEATRNVAELVVPVPVIGFGLKVTLLNNPVLLAVCEIVIGVLCPPVRVTLTVTR